MSHDHLHKIVEDLCNLGCKRVNEIIFELEQGKKISGVPELNQHETELLIHELKTIMAVYDKPE